MAGNVYKAFVAGVQKWAASAQTSAAAAAGQLLALNSSAQVDVTLLPLPIIGAIISWGAVGAVSASVTTYALPYTNTLSTNEPRVQLPVPVAGTIKSLRVWVSNASNAQSGTGSLVLTVRKNGSSTSLAVTLAAGTTYTTVQVDSNPAHAFTVVDTDLLSLQLQNNATATSLSIASASVLITS